LSDIIYPQELIIHSAPKNVVFGKAEFHLSHIALSMKLNKNIASQIALREIAEFSRA
jgi:hypothetical protein